MRRYVESVKLGEDAGSVEAKVLLNNTCGGLPLEVTLIRSAGPRKNGGTGPTIGAQCGVSRVPQMPPLSS